MSEFHDALAWVATCIGLLVIISGGAVAGAAGLAWSAGALLRITRKMRGYPYFLWVCLRNQGADDVEAMRRAVESMPLEDRWKVFCNTIRETRMERNKAIWNEYTDEPESEVTDGQ